jgi:hypothetical protein
MLTHINGRSSVLGLALVDAIRKMESITSAMLVHKEIRELGKASMIIVSSVVVSANSTSASASRCRESSTSVVGVEEWIDRIGV